MTTPSAAAVLFAKNMLPLAQFYAQLAGMRVTHEAADHVVLEIDRFQLIVHRIPEPVASAVVIDTPPRVREHNPIKLCLPVMSLAAARKTAMDLGGELFGTDREWEYNARRVCDGHDPEGNVFQLWQPVAS